MRRGDLKGYVPLTWDADSQLSADEQENVEINRRDLWRNGVRTEPNLTRMAFEFGAVMTMLRATARRNP
jgi:hypothetical protein